VIVTTVYQVTQSPAGWWKIRTAHGIYRTKNDWHASICEAGRRTHQQIKVWGGSGWYSREIDAVELVSETTPPSNPRSA
jgi:hypothetical protein